MPALFDVFEVLSGPLAPLSSEFRRSDIEPLLGRRRPLRLPQVSAVVNIVAIFD